MEIFFTGDSHFGHANIMKYCKRPFVNVNEMDEEIIQRWNEVIHPKDLVYHLGDFVFTRQDNRMVDYLDRLNGRIVLIKGNHDKRSLNWYKQYFSEVYYFYELRVSRDLFVLCHYAMRVWNKSHYGTFHLYGHSHGTLPGFGRSMDVGVDTNKFYPYHISSVVSSLEKIQEGLL